MKKIIIDTDGCSDDFMAIMMAVNDENHHIEMITTVDGGIDAITAANNSLVALETVDNYYPPIYVGSKQPILRNERHGIPSLHGKDGLSDMFLKPKAHKISEGDGVTKIIETINNDNDIEIIALGPLTNIALAIKLAPEVMSKTKRIVAMGSGGLGTGNVTPLAECNVWQDPIAAKIVVDSNIPFVYVGWDACRGDSFLNEEEINRIASSGPIGKMAIDVNRYMIDLNVNRLSKVYIDLADVAAMAAALYEDCIEECDKYYCDVDTSGGIADGAVSVDVLGTSGKQPNIWICSKLKPDLYKEYIYKTLKA